MSEGGINNGGGSNFGDHVSIQDGAGSNGSGGNDSNNISGAGSIESGGDVSKGVQKIDIVATMSPVEEMKVAVGAIYVRQLIFLLDTL